MTEDGHAESLYAGVGVRGGQQYVMVHRKRSSSTVGFARKMPMPELYARSDGGNGEKEMNVDVIATFEGNGSRPSHHGPGLSVRSNEMYTLNGTEVHGVVTERSGMKYLEKDGTPIEDEEREVERVKEIDKEHSDDDVEYDVRRLTPIECARLQGFPPDWCADVPHSDSAEYKLWGNGIALPSILPMMQNAVKYLEEMKSE